MYLETGAHDDKIIYRAGDLLAVTISPSNRLQRYGQQKRYNSFKSDWKTFFETQNMGAEMPYWFNIEISETIGKNCTKPRLHLHGVVLIKNTSTKLQWLLHTMPDIIGNKFDAQMNPDGCRLTVNHIINLEALKGWKTYCLASKIQTVIGNTEIDDFMKMKFNNYDKPPSKPKKSEGPADEVEDI